jgi:hypothetical protein
MIFQRRALSAGGIDLDTRDKVAGIKADAVLNPTTETHSLQRPFYHQTRDQSWEPLFETRYSSDQIASSFEFFSSLTAPLTISAAQLSSLFHPSFSEGNASPSCHVTILAVLSGPPFRLEQIAVSNNVRQLSSFVVPAIISWPLVSPIRYMACTVILASGALVSLCFCTLIKVG